VKKRFSESGTGGNAFLKAPDIAITALMLATVISINHQPQWTRYSVSPALGSIDLNGPAHLFKIFQLVTYNAIRCAAAPKGIATVFPLRSLEVSIGDLGGT